MNLILFVLFLVATVCFLAAAIHHVRISRTPLVPLGLFFASLAWTIQTGALL